MGITYFIFVYLKKIRLILFFILFIFTCACTTVLKKPSASFFSFTYEGEKYRIRSISCEDIAIASNELVGKRVLAKDFDKDTIIDQVVLGDMDLPEAQKIYEYGLNILLSENKLQEVETKIQSFQLIGELYNIKIKTFRPGDSSIPFNQFLIFDKKDDSSPIIIFVDQNADGQLDKSLKGNFSTEEYQTLYSDAISQGLQNNKLVKVDNMILVREE